MLELILMLKVQLGLLEKYFLEHIYWIHINYYEYILLKYAPPFCLSHLSRRL